MRIDSMQTKINLFAILGMCLFFLIFIFGGTLVMWAGQRSAAREYAETNLPRQAQVAAVSLSY